MRHYQIKAVVKNYIKELEEKGVKPERIDPNTTFAEHSSEKLLAHAYHLGLGIEKMSNNEHLAGKANRHFGSMQMCLSFSGWYTLNELRQHNKQ